MRVDFVPDGNGNIEVGMGNYVAVTLPVDVLFFSGEFDANRAIENCLDVAKAFSTSQE